MKSSEIQLGDLVFAPAQGRLTDASGQTVELRHQAMQVLRELASAPNEVVEKERLVARVWQNRAGAEEGLVQCIAEIRRVLNDTDKAIVTTIPRQGYRLVAAAKPKRTRSGGVLVVTAVAAVLVAGLAYLWWGAQGQPAPRAVVAVLPFQDTSPADHAAPIGDALSENIISTLARYSEFDVVARQSSFRFRETERDAREIGTALGAGFLVQGSQSLSADGVKISVQLIDTQDGTLRMVDAFAVPLDDVLEANDRLAHRIASTVSGSVVAAHARAPRQRGEIDALILDNRARLLFQTGPTREKWEQALDLQTQATSQFPDVEWGYIGKALMLRTGVRFGWEQQGPASVLSQAEAAANKALELNPQNYMAHFALGRVLMQKGDVLGSIAALNRAHGLNPSSSYVLTALGQSYIYADDQENLRTTLDRIAAVDPLPGTLSYWVRAWGQWQLGACQAARDTLHSMPSAPFEMKKLRAVIYVCVGDNAAAQKEIREYLEKKPDWSIGREVSTNATNWISDAPRERWLNALREAGVPQ